MATTHTGGMNHPTVVPENFEPAPESGTEGEGAVDGDTPAGRDADSDDAA